MVQFPEVVSGEPLKISASTFVAYRNCPDLALARLEGRFGPGSRAGFTGGLAHGVFARHLEKGPIPPEQFSQVCREAIGGSNLNYQMIEIGLRPSDLTSIIEEVGGLYQRFKSLPADGFAGAEVALSVDPLEAVNLVGKVDAVFDDKGGVRLVDWKTGQLGEPLDQLLFYALLWVLEGRSFPHVVEAVSVRTGERFSTVPTGDDLSSVADAISALVRSARLAWEKGDRLERRGGSWCRGCPLLEECPEGRAAVQLHG